MISVWLTVSVMVVRGRVRATAAAGSTVRSGAVPADAGLAVMVLTGPPEWSRGRRRLRQYQFRLGRIAAGVGAVAGDGEEDLVERRLVHAHRGDRHSRLAEPDQHVGGPVGGVERHVHPPRLGRRRGLGARDLPDDLPGEFLIGVLGQLHLQRRVADRGFQLIGRALGDLAAPVDHRDPPGELIRLVQVLGGEQDRAALGDQAADGVPHLPAGARVQARGRLVQKDQRRPGDQARGEVQAPAHAAGELRDRLVRRLLQIELRQQPLGGGAGVGRPQALQPAEHPQVLGGGQVLVNRRVLAGDADQLTDAVRFAGHVHAEYPGLPVVDGQQGGEHPQGRRLPRAIGAEDAEDLALAYLKVDSVDRTELAEGLDQAGGVNGCCSCHSENGRQPRLHRGYTAVSRTAWPRKHSLPAAGHDDRELARHQSAADDRVHAGAVGQPEVPAGGDRAQQQQRLGPGEPLADAVPDALPEREKDARISVLA